MAVPAVILKAKSAVKKGAAAYNTAKQVKNLTDGEELTSSFFNRFKIPLIIGTSIFTFAIFLLITLLSIPYIFANEMFGTSTNTTQTTITLDTQTLEKYYQASQEAVKTPNPPATDLATTEYKTIEGFNEHIKQQVNSAGYATRSGVVMAGITLVGDYILATGKRLRYSQGQRQSSEVDGIQNQNFYMDCSSFAWWALYNGGFKLPSYPQTVSQMTWAKGYNSLESIENGQAGDFLVSVSHILLILGTYDGGYYCAEFANSASGAKISKRDQASLQNGSYKLINMEKYYNDDANKR